MKGTKLLQALNQVDDQFLEEAEEPAKPAKRWRITWISVAAGIALLLAGAMLLPGLLDTSNQSRYPGGMQLSQKPPHATDSPADGGTPTQAAMDQVLMDQAPGDPGAPGDSEMEEQPAVLLKVVQWTDGKVEAVVDEWTDDTPIPGGTKLTVIFSPDCCYAVSVGGENYQISDGLPTAALYPPGSRMLALYTGFENGYLYVDMVYPGGAE